MHSYELYFIDMSILYQISMKNLWYITKLILMAYVMFYWIPAKVFPQEYSGKGVRKIVYNFVLMTAYVETMIPFLVFIKAFSILLFLITLFATRLIFLKYYYKKNITLLFKNGGDRVLKHLFYILDESKKFKEDSLSYLNKKFLTIYKSLTLYKSLQNFLIIIVFIYIISLLMARGMSSYSNPISDTAQFIDWVASLQNNVLYPDYKASADFYGQAVIIFFVNVFTNIDKIILFSLYPMLLLFALYISIYFVIKEIFDSKYTAIFAVIIHGIFLMSPLSDMIIGKVLVIKSPPILDILGLKIYYPSFTQKAEVVLRNGVVPYLRYISGLAYEHSSVFVLLNSYYLIKTLQTHLNRYLIFYGLTLMLVFIFHGGGAIVLIFISIFIAINAILFGKINLPILKKGILTVLGAAIVGNFWILSMIKYGIPQDFGAAAPFLDKLFGTRQNVHNIVKIGTDANVIVTILHTHLLFFAMIVIAYIISLFSKKRFLYSSYILIIAAIFTVYFGPNLGMPLLARQSRVVEYLFFALTMLFSFYFYLFFVSPIYFVFKKRVGGIITLSSLYIFFISSAIIVPRWIDTTNFWRNINELEYTSISDVLVKIIKNNRAFTWTVVSYVQEYAKIRNKGYHINTQDFISKFDPKAKVLKINTNKIYIFVENFPNPYKGQEEWYYRWRDEVQNNLKSWIALYYATHSNIKVYYKTKTVTVYEIDNSKYVEYLQKLQRKKR